LGIGAAALFCAPMPSSTDCVVQAAACVAVAFIVGLIWELAAVKWEK
jgi:hypothetical protein